MAAKAFIYYAHYVSDVVLREIARLAAELPEDYDLWLVGCSEDSDVFDAVTIGRVKTRVYARADLGALPYAGKLAELKPDTMRGNNDLALAHFFRDQPGYLHYWITEFDVRYTGPWAGLLGELDGSDADLLCTHLTRHAHDRGWTHWASLQNPSGEITDEAKLRGFMPFCRVSNRLFRKIDECCAAGWRGHYEALWPTIVSLEGLLAEEIGGNGAFTPDARRKRFYHSSFASKDLFLSTFGAWPVYDESSKFNHHVKDTLWHPVKEALPAKARPRTAAAGRGVAVVTMVYNEADFLPLWLDYYGRQVGAAHCYVIDHGSDDGSVMCSGAVNRIFLPRTGNFENVRAGFVKHFCDGLLTTYDSVIFADADEFLAADPDRFASLSDYCARNETPVVTALGINLLHRHNHEKPIMRNRGVFEQRSWGFAAASMSKPMLTRQKVNWTHGTHSYDGPMVFDGLINFHLALYDFDTALRRQAKRRAAAAEMPDIPDHHRITDDDVRQMFVTYEAMDVEEGVTLGADCPVSTAFIARILASNAERQNDYYKIDLSLKRYRLWEIPQRYRQML